MNEATILALIEKNIKKNESNNRIKYNGKNETLWKIGYHIVNEVTILAFGPWRKIRVIKN